MPPNISDTPLYGTTSATNSISGMASPSYAGAITHEMAYAVDRGTLISRYDGQITYTTPESTNSLQVEVVTLSAEVISLKKLIAELINRLDDTGVC
jgi:hypothetical protein